MELNVYPPLVDQCVVEGGRGRKYIWEDMDQIERKKDV